MDQFKLFTTAIIYRMKTIKTFASSERFLSTFLKLRNQSNVPLKTEGIQLQCDCCKIPIKIIEIFEMDKVIDKRIDIVIDEILRNSICDHYKDNRQCALSSVYIHPLIGTPQHFIFSFPIPGSDVQYINDFTFAGDWYEATIKVMPIESNRNVIFLLYEKYNERKLSKMIMNNLNILESNLDDYAEKLEVWQIPLVKTIADIMISQQEQETLLVANMKCMEGLILKDIDTEEDIGSNREVHELITYEPMNLCNSLEKNV